MRNCLRALARLLSRSSTIPAVIVLGTLSGATAHAQLRLDITQGVRDAVPIAVVPFGGQAEDGAGDVSSQDRLE